MVFKNPSDADIKAFLQTIHNIAVLGLSPKENRPSYQVASKMQQFNYQIIPVRPAVHEVLGETAYPDLHSVVQSGHFSIELVNVFRASEYVDEIIEQCIHLRLPAIWLQDGVIDHNAAQRAQDAGLFTVMDRCIYRDYMSLLN